MDPLMVLITESLRDYCLDVYWDIMMVNFLDTERASTEII